MNTPVKTTNIPAVSALDEFVGNVTIDGVQRTRRQSVENVARQLAGTAPLRYLSGVAPIFETEAELLAATIVDKVAAWVINDPDVSKVGIWGWNGTAWAWALPLPYEIVPGVDAGAGTANAIQITTRVPVTDGMMVVFSLFRDTTASPVTVSINGESALALVTNRGNNASALTANMDIWGRYRSSDNTIRLQGDQDISALVAQAEAARDEAVAVSGGRYNTVASVSSATIPLVVQYVDVAGYAAVADGGGHRRVRISTPSPAEAWHMQSADGAWWEVSEAEPNQKIFGAAVDDETDDTAAIQLAVDYAQSKGVPLKLFPGTSLITGSINVSSFFGFKMYGDTWQVTAEADYGAKLRTTSDDPILDIAASQFTIEGVAFKGTDSATSKGLYIHRPINADDMDAYVARCGFWSFNKAITQEGRGLYLSETNFVDCDVCLDHSWPTSGTDITNPVQGLPHGWRANRIINNRAHSCGVFVNTTGASAEYYRGLIMALNQMDIGDQLFRGGLIEGMIVNNLVEFVSSRGAAILVEEGGDGIIVESNILNAGANDGTPTAGAWSAIRVTSTASLSNASISRNKGEGWYRDGILIECNATNCNFDGNIIKNVGISGDPVYACLRFNGVALTSCTIIGGSLHSTVATAKNLSFQGSGTTLTDCYIALIAHDTTKDLIGTSFTDGGGNTIWRGNNAIGTTETGFLGLGTISPANPLHIVNSSSTPVKLQRTGSSGGVGISFLNTAGTFTVFGAPTGADDGAFTPGADNAITLGTGPLRWEQLFAGTATISTSDEREKEMIELINESILDAWGDVQWCTFRFKGRTRIHVGLIAQRVRDVFEVHGLDPFELGILCFDKWDEQNAEFGEVERIDTRELEDGTTEEVPVKELALIRPSIPAGNRYGIRYEEALALEAAYVRRRLDRIEARTTVH